MRLQEALEEVGKWVMWVASVGGAILVIWKWIASPLKNIMGKLDTVVEDVGDILCDRLNQAYTYHVGKGWCPKADKARLVEMYERYTAMGRNHLVSNYAQTLIALPEHPPGKQGR